MDFSSYMFNLILQSAAGNYITPNDKVYKRLVNGAEDNVLFFYDAIMEMA